MIDPAKKQRAREQKTAHQQGIRDTAQEQTDTAIGMRDSAKRASASAEGMIGRAKDFFVNLSS